MFLIFNQLNFVELTLFNVLIESGSQDEINDCVHIGDIDFTVVIHVT